MLQLLRNGHSNNNNNHKCVIDLIDFYENISKYYITLEKYQKYFIYYSIQQFFFKFM